LLCWLCNITIINIILAYKYNYISNISSFYVIIPPFTLVSHALFQLYNHPDSNTQFAPQLFSFVFQLHEFLCLDIYIECHVIKTMLGNGQLVKCDKLFLLVTGYYTDITHTAAALSKEYRFLYGFAAIRNNAGNLINKIQYTNASDNSHLVCFLARGFECFPTTSIPLIP
jgi:hypothetical protein